MDMALSPQDEAFRDEVRHFLDENLSEDLREAGRKTGGVFAEIAAGLRWHKVLAQRGWSAPTWPKEYGGTGWSEIQRYIFARECAAADAPRIFAMGLRMVGPVIMKYGTPEQKAKYLPASSSGDNFFCQGYSEPGSGSDLASLKTRAVRDGDDYVINGSKIWTTDAHVADRMFCLVRTSTEGKPQDGITFVLIDDEDAGPQREADHHPGRRPRGQPGLLRQRPHAGRQPHRAGECRLDGGQVPAGVRARRRCLYAQSLCPHRGHKAHRPRGGGRRLGPADRRAGFAERLAEAEIGRRRRWR